MNESNKTSIDEIINLLGEDYLPYGSMVPPIVQTSNFSVGSVRELRAYFTDEWGNHLYTRGNNPTVNVLRKKLAALEGTEDAICFSSGIASVVAAIMSEVKSGDHVICVHNPYTWTNQLLNSYLPKYGVECTMVDARKMDNIEAARKPNTKVLMLESPNSMTFEVQDLTACSSWCKKHGITSIIDNSYCSPIYQRPAEFGIDIVVHSGSKYLNGHSDVVCGVLCSDAMRVKAIADKELMTLGAIMSPFEAFLVLRGLRTLPVRLKHINESTELVFRALKSHPKVERIFFPFDPDNPQYKLARSQMTGSPGLFSVQLAAKAPENIERFAETLKMFRMAVSWGGHESLIIPMLAGHFIKGRPTPSLPWNHIRFYIGLEDPNLLIQDIQQALEVM